MMDDKINMETLAELIESDFLHCHQCSEQFSNPRILPCLHTFCEKCITKQSCHKLNGKSPRTKPTKDYSSKTDTGLQQNGFADTENFHTFECFICKSSLANPDNGVEDYPVDRFLSNLTELHDYKRGVQRSCEYCQFDGKTRPASSLCLDCKDDICESCAEAHRRTKVTRGHLVVPFAQIQNGLYDHDIRNYQKPRCGSHQDEALTVFCDKCEVLICSECKNDHSNHRVLDLGSAVPRYKQQIQVLLSGLKKHIPSIRDYIKFLSTYQDSVEENKLKLLSDLENQANKLHTIIDQQKSQMADRVCQMCQAEKTMVQEKTVNLETAVRSLENNAGYLNRLLLHGNPEEILSLHQEITFRLKQLVHMQLDGISKKLKMGFAAGITHKEDVHKLFGSLALGHVALAQSDVAQISPNGKSLATSSVMPNVKNSVELVTKFEAKGQNDRKDVWPTGVAITESDEIVIADRDNKSVKIFSISGELRREFSGKDESKLGSPFDVTVLRNGHIAVTDHEAEDVKVFTAEGDHVFSITNQFKYPRGITTGIKGEIIVVDCHLLQITLHDPNNGNLLKTIAATDDMGSKVMVDPYYLSVNSLGDILVTDTAAPNIKVFKPSGEYLAQHGSYGTKEDQILQPYGICGDKYGYLFVADNQNDRIHLLRPDGNFLQFLLSKSDGVWHPMAVTITKSSELVITEGLGQVKVFKYI